MEDPSTMAPRRETMLQDKEMETEEIRARFEALDTHQHQLLLDLSPYVASAARQPSLYVASAVRQPSTPVGPAAQQPSVDFMALAASAVRHPSHRHADNDDRRGSSIPWSTVERRSRRETRQAPTYDAHLDVRVSKLRHRNRSFPGG